MTVDELSCKELGSSQSSGSDNNHQVELMDISKTLLQTFNNEPQSDTNDKGLNSGIPQSRIRDAERRRSKRYADCRGNSHF